MTRSAALLTLDGMAGPASIYSLLTKRRSIDLCRVATCLCR
jgi:hypothetical protein